MNWYRKAQSSTLGGQISPSDSKEANSKASEMGHRMGEWNDFHTCVCVTCNRTASVYDTSKGSPGGIFGSAVREACDGTIDRSAQEVNISSFHERRNLMRQEAEERASLIGHTLGSWTVLNSSVCRKCSAVAQLNNSNTLTSYPDHSGSAVETPCRVYLETPDDWEWEDMQNHDPKHSLI
jgi:hypothetical protein